MPFLFGHHGRRPLVAGYLASHNPGDMRMERIIVIVAVGHLLVLPTQAGADILFEE